MFFRHLQTGRENRPLVCVAIALALALAEFAPLPASAPNHSPRVVSLLPSLTEDLFAIGAGAQVVATSQFTDYPPAAARLPQVATFSSVDAERVLELHPDVVVGIPSQAAMTADLRRIGLRIVLMSDDAFDDIFSDLTILGRMSGHRRESAALASRLRTRTAALVRTVPRGRRPRCLVVLGVAPIFTVGDRSYIAHLVSLAGGRNAAWDLPTAYGRYSEEVIVAHQPDVIVADAQSGLAGVLARPPWNALHAVRAHRVYILKNAAILERPGPRYNDGLAWLIARLHPHGS